MFTKRFRLTPGLRHQIISGIRAGAYPQVVVEAYGVPQDVFAEWLRRGAERKAREPYASFAREVRLAHAQARLRAEITLLTDDPKLWLLHGPGRERDDQVGWSTSVKPAEASTAERNVLLDPEAMRLLRMVAEALMPFPEAQRHVAQALKDADVEKNKKTPLAA